MILEDNTNIQVLLQVSKTIKPEQWAVQIQQPAHCSVQGDNTSDKCAPDMEKVNIWLANDTGNEITEVMTKWQRWCICWGYWADHYVVQTDTINNNLSNKDNNLWNYITTVLIVNLAQVSATKTECWCKLNYQTQQKSNKGMWKTKRHKVMPAME